MIRGEIRNDCLSALALSLALSTSLGIVNVHFAAVVLASLGVGWSQVW
jgi:hypothetical protein